jgi:hypothetical protein
MANGWNLFRSCACKMFFLVCLFAISPGPVSGQPQVSTSLKVAVAASDGAVIPKALVTVKNETTGLVSTGVTDISGLYVTPPLPPGVYDITVTANEFAETTQKGVAIDVGMASSVNITLPLGSGALVTSRDLLAKDKPEEKGFGLYSYILFGSPPNEATHERYLETLRDFLAIPSTREMVEDVPKKQLNVTYVPYKPVKGTPNPSSAEELLNAYDYDRASGLLARISCQEGEVVCGPYLEGPYIISTTKPLSEQRSLSHDFLYQNLSSVPPKIVTLWVDEFMKQSAQTEFWKERKGPHVALELRTAVAILAEGFPTVGDASDYWKKALAWK